MEFQENIPIILLIVTVYLWCGYRVIVIVIKIWTVHIHHLRFSNNLLIIITLRINMRIFDKNRLNIYTNSSIFEHSTLH